MTFIKGHKPVGATFQKGLIPWNKGRKTVIHKCGKCERILKVKNPSMLCRWCVKIGRKIPAEVKRKMSLAHMGYVFTEEHRKALSLANSGENHPMFGKKLTAERKKQIGDRHRGANSPNWRGGRTSEAMRIRNSPEYSEWRLKVYQRDRFSCIACGYRSRKPRDIRADHFKPFSLFPELIFDVNNGRTLCRPCDSKYGWNCERDGKTRTTGYEIEKIDNPSKEP